jgi:hypothetical protein
MDIQYNYQPRRTNSLLLIILYIVLGIYSCFAQNKERVTVLGTEFSAGSHRFMLENKKLKFSNISPLTKGVSGGFYAGNNLVDLRVRSGFYLSSPRKVGVEVIVAELDILINLYPLEFLRTKDNILDIYLTAGYSHNWINIREDITGYQDISPAILNLPGKGNYQVIGVGCKYIPHIGQRRTQFFSEALLSNDLSNMENTTVSINFGFRRILKWRA